MDMHSTHMCTYLTYLTLHEIFAFLIRNTFVQKWDHFILKGLGISILPLWREGSIVFYRNGLRNGRYTAIHGKYESLLTVLTVQHLSPVNGSSTPIQVGECFSAATSNPLQNHFRSLPFTWSATSLFAFLFSQCALCWLHTILWLLFSLLTLGSMT